MKKSVAVYAIVFDKFLYPKLSMASNYASSNGFKVDEAKEDDSVISFIQMEKSNFKLNAFGDEQEFKVVSIADGVYALVGELVEDTTKREEKEEKKNQSVRVTWNFTKQDESKRIVTGPVLVPNTVDLQGDFEFPEDIEMAAYKFMEDARNIGEMHTKFGGIGIPVESWVLREDVFVDRGDSFKVYPRGTWMMSVKVTDDKVWDKVRNGELTGFSIGFRGTREEV